MPMNTFRYTPFCGWEEMQMMIAINGEVIEADSDLKR